MKNVIHRALFSSRWPPWWTAGVAYSLFTFIIQQKKFIKTWKMWTVAARNPKTQTCALKSTREPLIEYIGVKITMICTRAKSCDILQGEIYLDVLSKNNPFPPHRWELISQTQMKYASSKSSFERFCSQVGTCQMYQVQLESFTAYFFTEDQSFILSLCM